MKARLTAYAGLQLRDYFLGRAVAVIVATAAATWAYASTRGLTLSVFDSAGGIDARDRLEHAFEFVLATFAFIAAAVAAQGLVARHRARAYDRLLFSRRMRPVRFYGQGFVAAGIGAVMVATAAAELYAVAVHPVSVVGVAGYVALTWLTIGGLAFALSTLTTFHVPLLGLAVGADFVLDHYSSGHGATDAATRVIGVVQYFLPPAHVVAALREPFARGLVVEFHELAWPVVFGIACLTVAVVLLRRRPFAS